MVNLVWNPLSREAHFLPCGSPDVSHLLTIILFYFLNCFISSLSSLPPPTLTCSGKPTSFFSNWMGHQEVRLLSSRSSLQIISKKRMTSFILTAHLCVFPMHTSVMYCYQSYSPIQTYPGTDTPAGLYWIQSWAGLHHPLSKGNSFDSFPLPCVMRQLPRWQRSKKPGVRPSHLG